MMKAEDDGNGGMSWTEEAIGEGERDRLSWTTTTSTTGGLGDFKPMPGGDWYLTTTTTAAATVTSDEIITENGDDPSTHLAFGTTPQTQLDMIPSSSSSTYLFNMVDPSPPPFFPQKTTTISSLLNAVWTNPFDPSFDLDCDSSGFLVGTHFSNSPVLFNTGTTTANGGGGGGGGGGGDSGCGGVLGFGGSDLGTTARFPSSDSTRLPYDDSFAGLNPSLDLGALKNSPLLNRPKIIQPLEIFPKVGIQPTLFQKRTAALAQDNAVQQMENFGVWGLGGLGEEDENRRKGDEVEETSVDGSAMNYDTDETAAENVNVDESAKNGGGNGSTEKSVVKRCGELKGKKKGLPAKNLMAERRRRKKLNDRLYMLRSVVPKISKMDRASILGDTIEYLKELLQRINDLHNELESPPSGSSLMSVTTAASVHPLTPPTLPCRVKEELCSSSLANLNSQPARIEVREQEGQAVNIHMLCARRPGLLLSAMSALDGLGLDIQQAVISCFNGFALDVFRAVQCKDGHGIPPEEIKAVLLHSAGFHSAI